MHKSNGKFVHEEHAVGKADAVTAVLDGNYRAILGSSNPGKLSRSRFISSYSFKI